MGQYARCHQDFNPRSRMGSDGSTRNRHSRINYFNPRSRMGSDNSDTPRTSPDNHFNPRSRMGSDDAEGANQEKSHHFNPRSRMGSDHPHDVFQYVSSIFQSTLPHGERPHVTFKTLRTRCISIHAPAWGATSAGGSSSSFGLQFQSTLPHGERL